MTTYINTSECENCSYKEFEHCPKCDEGCPQFISYTKTIEEIVKCTDCGHEYTL